MMDLKKYSWSLDKDDEIWNNGTFDTIEECINDAVRNYHLMKGETIAIGETVSFGVYIDADDIIERIEDEAYEHAGESSEGWLSYTNEERDNLSERLTECVEKWLAETNNEPNFYCIDNIREITI